MCKLKKRNGFTLVEMLIVIAIIAILIAIAIPTVSTALENSRVAVDQANERAAQGAAVTAYLANSEKWLNSPAKQDDKLVLYYWIDAASKQGAIGGLKPADDMLVERHWGYGVSKPNKGKGVQITLSLSGEILSTDWV